MLKRLRNFSLSTWILVSLAWGVFFGIFLGELCAPLNFIGKAFIKLLQMGVLPYMVVSLIHGVASLSYDDARLIGVRGCLTLLLFWGLGLGVIYGFSLAFPFSSSSSFFSVSEPKKVDSVDLLDYYIPANIFDALSDNLIPAIVFFSVSLGISLLMVKNRDPFLNILSILSKALSQMTKFVIKAAPVGVFALTAAAVGTISIEQLQRLQVYFVTYILACSLLVFWVLPMAVTCFTPFTFREVISFSRDALALGFSTGNNFVVLAVIADRSKELLSKLSAKDQRTGTVVDSVLPLAYSFPNVGKLMEVLFILFVAWHVNQTLGIGKQIELAFAGVMSLFGSPKVGIPFLLDYMELPGGYFDLYLMSDVVTRRFKILLETMSMMTITLIVTCIILRKSIFSSKRIILALSVTIALMVVSVTMARFGLKYLVGGSYQEDRVLLNMQIKNQAPFRILQLPYTDSASGASEAQLDTMKRILNRGAIRVGYDEDALPFAFYNSRKELVGYDIYFAHLLARNLGVSLDLIPLKRSDVRDCLENGVCDIVMSAFPMRTEDLGKMNFSRPYMQMKSALIIKDFRKNEFQRQSDIKTIKNLKIAVTPQNSPDEVRLFRSYFPNAEIVQLPDIKTFFSNEHVADALLTTDKIGKAWALLYPEYGVVVPSPLMFVYDLSYPVAIGQGDHFFLYYLNNWLNILDTNGELSHQFDYWILGKTPDRKVPRWSIVRNVLGWVD